MSGIVRQRAFTLVELMVAMTITVVIIGLLATVANFTTNAWRHGEGQAETSASARGALSLIGRELQGAVIDLDLGYYVQTTDKPNNFVLKFLARRVPKGDDTAAVEKVAYQLAWASRGLLPEVTADFDDSHRIPVLIRTVNYQSSLGLNDVFDPGANPPDDWVKNWGTLNSKVQTGKISDDGDITEVVAENVIGWRVNPIYWDRTLNSTGSSVVDDPSDNGGRFYDTYITSDLKFMKRDKNMSSLTADVAPRAIELRVASIGSNILPRATPLPGWKDVFSMDDLFEPYRLADSSFNNLLKKNVRIFDGTYYLSSRTP